MLLLLPALPPVHSFASFLQSGKYVDQCRNKLLNNHNESEKCKEGREEIKSGNWKEKGRGKKGAGKGFLGTGLILL